MKDAHTSLLHMHAHTCTFVCVQVSNMLADLASSRTGTARASSCVVGSSKQPAGAVAESTLPSSLGHPGHPGPKLFPPFPPTAPMGQAATHTVGPAGAHAAPWHSLPPGLWDAAAPSMPPACKPEATSGGSPQPPRQLPPPPQRQDGGGCMAGVGQRPSAHGVAEAGSDPPSSIRDGLLRNGFGGRPVGCAPRAGQLPLEDGGATSGAWHGQGSQGRGEHVAGVWWQDRAVALVGAIAWVLQQVKQRELLVLHEHA